VETPPWLQDFVRQTLANALGTLIAALVLFLGAQLFGLLDDVPTSSTITAALALLGALAGLWAGSRTARYSLSVREAEVSRAEALADRAAREREEARDRKDE
jgi:hypothetical protein